MPFDAVDKFGKTFFDVWRMRASDFLDLRNDDPTCYLSPYQFLMLCATLALSMLLINIGLVDGLLKELAQHKVETDASVRAGRLIIFVLASILFGSLFVSFSAKRWPIRRTVQTKSIFEIMSYGLGALLLPLAALDVLVGPVIAELVLRDALPLWTIYLPFIIGFIAGNLMFFRYLLPSYAHVLKVSKSRVFWGLALWGFVVSFIIGFVIGFVFGFIQGFQRAVGS